MHVEILKSFYRLPQRQVAVHRRLLCGMPLTALLLCSMLAGCATSPLGQPQLRLFPEGQMVQMGATAYRKMQRETPVLNDPAVTRYVRCVARQITAAVPGSTSWEVTVFRDDEANAFALPGGKIGVNAGLLKVARNQDQLATVLAHEVAHVIAEHHNARVSAAYATDTGLKLIEAVASGNSQGGRLMGLLGLGAKFGVLMPYDRGQEREADLIGLDLMAKTGFDPLASVELWRNMARAGGSAPPAFLSTHPTHGQRIEDLRERMPRALELYRRARQSGKKPQCR